MIILMHGFPDNVHLYDRIIPYLSPARRVLAFDFLGWGASDNRLTTHTPQGTKRVIWTRWSESGNSEKSFSLRMTLRGPRQSIGLSNIISRWPR